MNKHNVKVFIRFLLLALVVVVYVCTAQPVSGIVIGSAILTALLLVLSALP